MAQRILIVEDDPDVIRVARAYLEREGFTVETAQDGLAGLHAALDRPPTLIVLDWMLPHLDGLAFLERLRKAQRTPVIMLTARTEESDRVVGLELGADDYISKPFSPRELVARVRAVLRRARSAAEDEDKEEVIEHLGLQIDPRHRTVESGGRRADLTALEFDLLYALAGAPGRVFSRDELLDRVWGQDFTGVDRVVDVHMSNLRHKLAVIGADAMLVTVRGVGYKFE